MVGLTHRQDHRTKTPKKKRKVIQGPTNSELRGNNQVTSAFLGHALKGQDCRFLSWAMPRRILDTVQATLEIGNNASVSSHRLSGSASEARVTDVVCIRFVHKVVW